MQRWNNAANGVVYNESSTGLIAIHRMIASATAHGIKLILPFAGNWRDFGGMDQYVTWGTAVAGHSCAAHRSRSTCP